ncbi:alpha-L-fucosidase [Pendulispora rubella]|uniref:alpha-L-fucosidase n=1 Tax=Pendulispora rubella TaxID=2741070 RepID=A0ABZ2KYV6_9BACT
MGTRNLGSAVLFAAMTLSLSLTAQTDAMRANQVVTISSNDTTTRILAKAASVTPSARQLAWQRMELTAFLHFGPNTFDDREWGTGTEDPNLFNPSALDTDQWVTSLQQAGFKQAILTAKHHDGYLLYPTRYSTQSVKSSSWQGGKGNVLRSFVDSAHKFGMRVGFYLSPADMHEALEGGRYGNGSTAVTTTIPEPGLDGTRPPGPAFTVTADDYNRYYMNTLYELLTEYGPIDEVWWDGANAVSGKINPSDFPDWTRLVRGLQPDAVIFQDGGPDVRWVGNENGVARESEYSVLPFTGSAAGAVDRITLPADVTARDLGSDTLLGKRNADGTSAWNFLKWLPAECDARLEPGWFWSTNRHEPKSLVDLQSMYYASVGRNCVLLLDVPPDNRGRLTDADIARLNEFAQWRLRVFGIDLARGARAANGDDTTNTAGNVPAHAVDGNDDTQWQPASSTGVLMVDLGAAQEVNAFGLQENIRMGQRVTSFVVDAWQGGAWTTLTWGTVIGYKRLVRLSTPVTTSKLRLRITSARGPAAISTFGVYRDR